MCAVIQDEPRESDIERETVHSASVDAAVSAKSERAPVYQNVAFSTKFSCRDDQFLRHIFIVDQIQETLKRLWRLRKLGSTITKICPQTGPSPHSSRRDDGTAGDGFIV